MDLVKIAEDMNKRCLNRKLFQILLYSHSLEPGNHRDRCADYGMGHDLCKECELCLS